MTTRDAVALEVNALSVRFGRRLALDSLSLTATEARLTAILGPNGAGKTTLLRSCTGLLKPDAGHIRVFGSPTGRPDTLTRVGLMPQSTGAWSGIKAGELLRYLASLYAQPQNVDALIERCAITEFAQVPYRRLSGGQQQAVNLAGALIGRPELVFLDEPTAGMDPHARRATWQLLTELRDARVTIVLTTHAMEEAQRLADQVYILDAGRVAVAGTVPELTRGGRTLEDVFLAHTRLPVTP